MEKYKDRLWLKKQVEVGRGYTDIAKEFGVDPTTIRYWIKKHNLNIKKEVKYSIQNFICPVCNKEFSKRKTKDSQVVYCSQECAYKGRTLKITKINRPNKNRVCNITYLNKKCEYCKKDFVVEKTKKNRKYCSRECFLKQHKINMNGKNNPSYINGASYNKRSYRGEDWDTQRQKCYERDDYTCQRCGVKCIGRKELNDKNKDRLIQCHHIVKYKISRDNSLQNLMTLCVKCHGIIENKGD